MPSRWIARTVAALLAATTSTCSVPPPSATGAAPAAIGSPGQRYPLAFSLLATPQARARRQAEVAVRLPPHVALVLHGTGLVYQVLLTGDWARPDGDDPFRMNEQEMVRWRTFFDRHADLFGLRPGRYAIKLGVARHGFDIDAGPDRPRAIEVHKGTYTPLGGAPVAHISSFYPVDRVHAPRARVPARRLLGGLVGLPFQVRVEYEPAGRRCRGCDAGPAPPPSPPFTRVSTPSDFLIEERVLWVCRDPLTVEVRRTLSPRLAFSQQGMPAAFRLPTGGHRPVLRLAAPAPGWPNRPHVFDAITGEDLSARNWSGLTGHMRAEDCAGSARQADQELAR